MIIIIKVITEVEGQVVEVVVALIVVANHDSTSRRFSSSGKSSRSSISRSSSRSSISRSSRRR